MAETYGFRKLISYVLIVIVLVFIILYMYGEEGALTNLKEKVLGIAPNVSIGAEKEFADKPTVLPEHQTQINEMKTTIQEMLDVKGVNDCFAKFSGFPDPLTQGNAATKIILTSDGEKTFGRVLGGAGGVHEVETFELDMILCVIGGDESFRETFIETFLSTDEERDLESEAYFNIVGNINIEYGKKDVVPNQNVIDHGQGPEKFHGNQWLFKTQDNVICFFPSHGDNLPKKYFDPDNEESIPTFYENGKIKKCLGSNE